MMIIEITVCREGRHLFIKQVKLVVSKSKLPMVGFLHFSNLPTTYFGRPFYKTTEFARLKMETNLLEKFNI